MMLYLDEQKLVVGGSGLWTAPTKLTNQKLTMSAEVNTKRIY